MSGAAPSRFVRFRVGGTAAALPLAIVREVMPRPAMVAVPGGRSGLAGVALARGLALPVYDLRGLVGAGTSTGRSRAEHVIVCDWGEVSVGILGGEPDLLDGVPERADPAEGGIMSGTCGAGLLTRGGEVVTVLDAARLFASLGVPEDGSTDAREAEGEDDPAGR